MKTPHDTCELAIPAGSLQCALYAFKGGADAVYFGLKSFSARKGAVNFSFEDVRKIKAYCLANDKKYYVTLNTLVSDDEITQIISLLRQLDYLQPDGVIVQDLGIARIMREHFPSLPLHGSTQLAVHTIDGVKQLHELGFSRVVLSRELSFEEIKEIREACPDIELKVFIHGALCYGFSGLCMASQFITGDGHDSTQSRSANRGSCAQICRTWFHCNDTGSDSWLFSMKDLCLGDKVRQFARIGIDSLKVEGRMKGPDYAYWCARYYRMLLDGQDENEQEVRWAKEAMQISFSRDTTEYFFDTGRSGSMNAPNMVCAKDPGHKGILAGTIDKVLPNGKAVVRFSRPVALRDGLKVQGVSFSLRHIDGGKSFISEDEVATINFPAEEFEKRPGFGTPVYCVSRHNLNMGLLNENIPLYKKPINLDITIHNNAISVNGKQYSLEIQQAKSQSDLHQILTKVFEASDRSYFTLGNLTVANESPFSDPFIPMSALKQIRRSFYQDQDDAFETGLSAKIPAADSDRAPLPPRSALGLWDSITQIEGNRYLPLAPVMFDEKQYLKDLDSKVSENTDLIIGLNNIAQVRWAKSHPELKFFADVFLYTQNSHAFASLKAELPSLVGSYELDRNTPFNYVGDDYVPPIFISRVCLRHSGLDLPCKGCSRNNTFHLEQNGKRYRATCINCITVVTKE